MSLKFKCDVCGNYHHAYVNHFSLGKVCGRCAIEVRIGTPLELAVRVRRALGALERIERSAYRAIREGCSAAVMGMSLAMKTKALIRHDRILRGEA
jgi:hypothetical protein